MNSKSYFNEIASQWDGMRKGFFSEAVRNKAFIAANVQEGKLAADIGAGTGFIAEGLLKKGLKVIAVDQSELMVTEMKEKFNSPDKIDYRIGEAESLPIENEYVDYVFANMYLHHVESPPKAIKEMTRVLKREGKLVITDLDEHSFNFLKEEHHDRWMGFNRKDVKQWFLEADLKNIAVECSGENCCSQSNSGNEYADISIFVSSGER